MGGKRKAVNDQGPLIQALRNQQYMQAWELVKMIGIREMPDFSVRMLVFMKAAHTFDPFVNNNFIMYFKNQIYWYNRSKNSIPWDMESIWPDDK